MTIIDLFSIIDGLSETSFMKCRNHLYSALGFSIVPLEDVRRVDLKEKIMVFFQNTKYKTEHLEIQYVMLAEGILTHYVTCTGNRDQLYEKRRKALAAKLEEESDKLSDLEDYFMIFLSQCREFTDKGNYSGGFKISQTDYSLVKSDINTVYTIWKKVQKHDFEEHKRTLPLLGREKVVEYTASLSHNQKLFIYVINILLLYWILEYRGEI